MNKYIWRNVDELTTNGYDSFTKRWVSDTFLALCISDFKKDEMSDKDTLPKPIERIATLVPLALPPYFSGPMQKKF